MTPEEPRQRRKQARLLKLVERLEKPNAPFFDVRPYVPAGVDVEFVEKAGFMMGPHVIWEYSAKVIRQKNPLIIFQCLLRYSLGFWRPTCVASNSFIAQWTGLEPQNVRVGLKELMAAEIIKISRPSTHSSATEYVLPIVEGYLEWFNAKKAGELKDSSAISKVSLPSGEGSPGNQLTYPIEIIPKKENLNKNQETHPQLNASSPELELYLRDIKPTRKQESERFFFGQLKMDFSEDEILLGVQFLQRHGVLGTKEICHSPLKYLSVAAAQVVTLAKAEATKRETRVQAEQGAQERQRQEIQQQTTDDAVHRLALEKFQQTFDSDEQNTAIENFLSTQYPGTPFRLPRHVALFLTARSWFDRLGINERREGNSNYEN